MRSEMEKRFKTLDDLDAKNKTVLVRVDINSPLDPETKKIIDDSRIRLHASTLDELSSKGAKVVVLAHQGRPGDPDFSSLSLHATVLQNYVKAKVKFVNDVIGEKAISTIKSLNPGEILMLENVRTIPEEMKDLPPEQHAKGKLVKTLSEVSDAFVNDAFAAAHRAHASIVGFTVVLPSYAGRVMEREVYALDKVYSNPEKPSLYVLGGAKPKETFKVVEHVLSKNKADEVLVGGMVSTVFLHCASYDVGEKNVKEIEEKGFGQFYGKVKDILAKYEDRLVMPYDVAVDLDGKRKEFPRVMFPPAGYIRDIGKDTVEIYSKILKVAKSIVINGPMGMFEDKRFSFGTVELIKSLKGSKAFSVLGGGHSVAAVESYGLAEFVSYISSGGGAMISFLSGEKLPGIEALEKAK
ncbi:MAG: phosphoglycerate kinase [Thermoproteota archaeon]